MADQGHGNMKGASSAPGQQKLHTVRNAAGETRQVTQEQWRNRANDSSLQGFERVDAEGGATQSASTSSGSGSTGSSGSSQQ